MEEQKTEDYKERLQKARQRRNGKDPMHWFMIGGCAVIVVLALVIIVKLAQGGTFGGSGNARVASASEAGAQETVIGETLPEDEEQAKEDEEKKNVVESYQNLGIVDVSGYLNMRESASTTSDVIGKLMGGSACEILDDSQEGWYQVSSGGLEGYISSEFVQTGEAAKTEAFELVKKMAVITTDKLNIRSEPSEDAQVLEQALKNERYSIVSEQDGWIQISEGYISADYVDVRYALNEARKLDLRTMVFNMYDNLGISNVNNYLNIRVEPKEDAKIIGKMTSKSGGEILETTEDGGWYKIKSGPVTGYVKSEFILTGDAAKQEALQVAQLMAIVSTDRLNARTEPNTDAPIWTQISNSERYSVMSQQDGWVQIALDETSAYVATEFVDVRYALNEAIEESGETEGVLVLINTVGGDVSCGLALAEMIASLSKPTVSLVIGDSHSIGVPLAVAVDHSFIVPTGTMMVHPVRMTGMVIGAVQTYDYFEMIQDRILSFVSGHSQISYERLRSLMLNTEMMTKDLGTVLVGGEAVQEGLIDECGGIREALAWLNRAIDGKKQEIDAHDRMTKTDFSENLKRK